MEFYHLRSFVTVAENRHLTRAAEQLHVSQPAVSAHIKALEVEIGVTLFVRTATGMQLTTEGELLCRQARVILREADAFMRQGEELLRTPRGVVRIGLNRDAEFLRISVLYRELRRSCPHVDIVLHQSISGTIVKSVAAEELDCGFILGDCRAEGISRINLAGFRLRVVGPIDFREKLEIADLAMLAELPWIGIPDDCPYSHIIKKYFQDRGLRLRTEVVADQQAAIVSMIQSGAGLNFMLEEEAVAAEKEGTIALWPGEPFPIELSFVWRSRDTNSLVMKAVLKVIQTSWPDIDYEHEDDAG